MTFTQRQSYLGSQSGGYNYLFSFGSAGRLVGTGNLAIGQGHVIFKSGSGSGSTTHTFDGDLVYSGGSALGLAKHSTASTTWQRLQVSNLATPTAGNSLLCTIFATPNATTVYGSWTTGESHVIVTGSKPSVLNGIVSPGIQFFGGSSDFRFMTFDGNLLLPFSAYTSTDLNTAGANDVVGQTGAKALSAGDKAVYALRHCAAAGSGLTACRSGFKPSMAG